MNADNVFGTYEVKGLKHYTIQRDKQDMVHVLYCNRCDGLIDISPFKSDITTSCGYHDKIHESAGPELSGDLDIMEQWEFEYREGLPPLEMFEGDFRGQRRRQWQELIGANEALFGYSTAWK